MLTSPKHGQFWDHINLCAFARHEGEAPGCIVKNDMLSADVVLQLQRSTGKSGKMAGFLEWTRILREGHSSHYSGLDNVCWDSRSSCITVSFQMDASQRYMVIIPLKSVFAHSELLLLNLRFIDQIQYNRIFINLSFINR